MVAREMLLLNLFSPELLWILGWHVVEAGMKLGNVGQLPCILEIPPEPSKSPNEAQTQWQHIQLVLSSSESMFLPHQANSDTFFLQDKAGVLLPYIDKDVDKLECKVGRYFTANIQILWPGLPQHQALLPTWYIVTITHMENHFRIITFCFQPAEAAQGTGPAPLSGVFSLYTKASKVQAKLQETVFLSCGFVMDHIPKVVDVTWVLRQKGGRYREVLKYTGKQGQVVHLHKQVEIFPSEIPRGNASIQLSNMAIKDEGNYFCSVVTAGLHGELGIDVAVVEAPKVTLFPQTPTLTLKEGEEQKLVCEVSRYFPLEAHVQWLREPVEGRMLPEVVRNVLFGNHRQSSDETYSFSSYYLLKASLRDDGVRYTCRVEHEGLQFPIRKSIVIKVTEKSQPWLWLLSGCCIILLVLLLKYLHQVKSADRRKFY
ncbi:tapasin-related protein-like [Macrotis lagotis]|uniref:tapasin-related protein-like n=1 Tax=Macrotis lagotis TaxID=92651 RepID=UPI003D68B214